MHTAEFIVTSSDVKYEDHIEGEKYYFHFNSDMSGDVIINTGHPDMPSKTLELHVPGWMLLEFVGRFMNSELISEVEQWSGRETLAVFQRIMA